MHGSCVSAGDCMHVRRSGQLVSRPPHYFSPSVRLLIIFFSFPYTTKPITMRRLPRQRVSPTWLHGWVARMMLPCPEPTHHLYEGQCEIL